MINKEIRKIFFLYIGVFYVFPFIIGLLIPETFTDIYRGFNSVVAGGFVLLFLVLVFIIDKVAPSGPKIRPFKGIGNLFESKWFNFTLITTFLVLAIRFSSKYGITFRQNGEETLGQTGFESIFLFALKTYTIAFILYIILKSVNEMPVLKWQRLVAAAIALSYVFIIVSSLDMLYILGCIIVVFKKEKILFDSFKIKKSTYRSITRMVMLITLALSVVFVGYADKVGTQRASQIFSDAENVKLIVEHTTARVGVWYASVMAMGNRDIFDDHIALSTIDGITSNLTSRLGILTSSGEKGYKKRPENWSAARSNYLQLYKIADNSRTGAAPGVIASSFYLPFFPLNFILIATYTVFILRKLSKSVQYAKKSFNFLGRFMLLFYFATTLFANPIGYLNFIDPTFLYLLMFLGALDKITHSNLDRLRKMGKLGAPPVNNPVNNQYAA